MAVIFLKSILAPGSTSPNGKYTPLPNLPDNFPDGSLEQGLPLPAETPPSTKHESHSEAYSQAYPTADEHQQPFRINPRLISDATIGLSDGLTVPFALTAGLSALGDARVVIYAGLAELIAGGISMGLGGYLGAKSEADAYRAALASTRAAVASDPARAAAMARAALAPYALDDATLDALATSLLRAPPHHTVAFLMRFHHNLAEDDYAPSRAFAAGLTVSMGYVLGGLVPLLPYVFVQSVTEGFRLSVVVMGLALFLFGWVKTALVGERDRWACVRNGVQMVLLGGVAAGAAMGCVKAIEG